MIFPMKAHRQYLEHTADILFVAEAPNLEQLFQQCGLAAEESMVDIKKVEPIKKIKIELEAKDIEKLLFDFMNELIFYKDAEQLIFSKFEIKITEKEQKYKLLCTAYGEKINPEKHNPKVDIKAITLHMFKVEQTQNGWKAKVLMDI